jgi:hypothetical protein
LTICGKIRLSVLLVLMLCYSCDIENADRGNIMMVELDVFSGRPNPSWQLSAEQVDELLGAFQGLLAVDQVPPENDLGYRGFVLQNPGGVGGLPSRIRVCNGLIVTSNGHVQVYQDTNLVEHQLFKQAAQHGYQSILDSVLP